MKLKSLLGGLFVVGSMTLSATAADTTVTLSEVHLCCGNCVKGAATALAAVPTAKGVCDQKAGTIALTAPDQETAQKAVNALIASGYFGKSSDSAIKVEAPSGAADSKVKTMDVTGVHLCCAKCVTAVKEVLTKVDGVTANTVAPKASTFTVTGDFNGKSVFDGLNKAGLSGKVGSAAHQ